MKAKVKLNQTSSARSGRSHEEENKKNTKFKRNVFILRFKIARRKQVTGNESN